jgi:hypothetical protein
VRPSVASVVRVSPLAAALTLAAWAAPSAAQIPPGGIADLAGPRTVGLSASIGSATGNDGLFVNAGAIAARRRYEVELGAYVERRGNDTVTQLVGGSVVDALTSPVAVGLSYRRATEGAYTGNLYQLTLALPVARGFFLGATGKWLSLKGPEITGGGNDDVSAGTMDAGFLFQVNRYVSVGGAGYNLVPTSSDVVAPTGAGAGIGLDSGRRFHVGVDWRIDFDRGDGPTNRYSAGAEVLVGGFMPIRGGYVHDETLDTEWWSVGTGFVTKDVALDVAYRQSVDDASARMLVGAVRLYVFD